MAAPERISTNISSSNTATGVTGLSCNSGDLIICAVASPDNDGAITVSLYDTTGPTLLVTLSTPDASITVGTKVTYIFSWVATTTLSGTFSSVFNNWPSGGNGRRNMTWVVRPPSGSSWDASGGLAKRTATNSSIYTDPPSGTGPWGMAWSATDTGGNGGCAVACIADGTTRHACDMDDGSGSSYELTYDDGEFGGGSTNAISFYGDVYADNAVGDNTLVSFDVQEGSASTFSAVAAYYYLALPSGSATISGTGGLSSSGVREAFRSATLAGTGSLTATGTSPYKFGSATIAGTGGMTAAGVAGRFGQGRSRLVSDASTRQYTTTYSKKSPARGNSIVWAGGTGRRTKYGTASLGGAGDLTATGVRTAYRSASPTAVGGLTADPTLHAYRSATLPGVGGMLAIPTRYVQGSATLAGNGDLSASAVRTAYRSATLAGTGDLTATATRTAYGAASIAGAGGMTASGFAERFASATIAGVGGLTSSGARVVVGSATLTGVSGISVNAGAKYGSAALAGVGSLTATGVAMSIPWLRVTRTAKVGTGINASTKVGTGVTSTSRSGVGHNTTVIQEGLP